MYKRFYTNMKKSLAQLYINHEYKAYKCAKFDLKIKKKKKNTLKKQRFHRK